MHATRRCSTAALVSCSPATTAPCCPSPTPGAPAYFAPKFAQPALHYPSLAIARATPSRVRSVEELARYFGSQLRSKVGSLWTRVVFDVAVSSGPGQAGIVRFAGGSAAALCLARFWLNISWNALLAAGDADSVVVGLTGGGCGCDRQPSHRKFSSMSSCARSRLGQHRRMSSSAAGQSYKISNAVSARVIFWSARCVCACADQ